MHSLAADGDKFKFKRPKIGKDVVGNKLRQIVKSRPDPKCC